jgi:phosphohistidine swiveling domain-containing protein
MSVNSWVDDDFDPADGGGKAASLAVLHSAGFAVPTGFVIGAHVFRDVAEPLVEELDRRLGAAAEDLAALEQVDDWFRDSLAQQATSHSIFEDVIQAYLDLGQPAVAVRSSATAEDLADASFAGQYDTVLDVRGPQDVFTAVLDVWASLYSPRAVRYRAEHDIDGDLAMAVIVQSLVPADAAGVMFTCDPVTGDADRVVITAARGLGEGVVAGTAPTDTYGVAPGGAIVDRQLASDEAVLADTVLVELAEVAGRVRSAFGDHRDIEFAVAADHIWLLQARPVTGLDTGAPKDEFAIEWDDPADADRSWRLRGNAPAFRLELDIQAALANRMSQGFAETGSPMMANHLWCVHHGYIYVAAPHADREETSAKLKALGELAETYAQAGTSLYHAEVEPLLLERLTALGEAEADDSLPGRCRYLAMGLAAYADAMGTLHWRMRTAEIDWNETYADITGRPEAEAPTMLQAIHNRTTEMITQLRRLAWIVQSDPELVEIFEHRHWEGLDDLSAEEGSATREFRDGFGVLLDNYGLRTGMGLGSIANYRSPTWTMDTSIPLGIISSYARQDLSELDARDERLATERRQLEADVRSDLSADPDRLHRFNVALARVVNGARTTEDHNHLMEQACGGSMREAVWKMGLALVSEGMLSDPDEVFHLSMAELEALAGGEGPTDVAGLVESRVDEAARQRRLHPPRTLGAEATRDPMAAMFSPPEGAGLDGRILRGIAASRGIAVGPARVVEASLAPPDVRRGDVLVASMVGDAWAPVFPLLGGLVLDYGGVSQHAAVVAREYGIPAVMMTGSATTSIGDGQVVTVNGDEGFVVLDDELGEGP